MRAAIEKIVGLSTYEGQHDLIETIIDIAGDEDGDGMLTLEEINARQAID